MRIISGRYKGRRISVPNSFKARPTTDFAKENLFNVLDNSIYWEECQALDLFGGTGSIALELVSRGCTKVFCIEKEPAHYTFIEKAKDILKAEELTVYKMDVFKYLSLCKQQFDIIFADPPYDMKKLSDIPQIILDKDLIAPGGTFIMEHSKEYDFSNLPLFSEKRIYGSVNFSIFRKESKDE